MGIQGLSKLVADVAAHAIKENEIKNYFGRKIAIDASMSLYQFLIAIRWVVIVHRNVLIFGGFIDLLRYLITSKSSGTHVTNLLYSDQYCGSVSIPYYGSGFYLEIFVSNEKTVRYGR